MFNFIRKSIKLKISLSVMLAIFMVFSLAVGYIIASFSNITKSSANKLLAVEAAKQAGKAQSIIDDAFDTARTLATSFEGMVIEGRADRETANAILKNTVLKNKDSFIGISTCWEPNMFDGLDAKYINSIGHDNTGRFIPYWFVTDDLVIVTSLTDYDSSDWYTLALKSGEETIIEPYDYVVNGKHVMMTSAIVPIKINGKTVGIVGVDIALDKLKEATTVKLYKTGYGVVVSNLGTIVTHPESKMVKKNVLDISVENKKLLSNALKNGKAEQFSEISTLTNLKTLRSLYPLHLGKSKTPWSFIVSVPESEVMDQANKAFTVAIVILIFGFILIGFIIYFVTGKLTKVIPDCASYMEILASGDFSVRPPDEYMIMKDEAGVLAHSANTMTANVSKIIEEVMEQSKKSVQNSKASKDNLIAANEDMKGISATTEALSAGMQEMAASVEEMNASANEIEH